MAFPVPPPEQLLGWVLLRLRSRFQKQESLTSAQFQELLRGHGFKVDHSRLSRWERGRLHPNAAVLASYEQMCRMPPYSLRVLAQSLFLRDDTRVFDLVPDDQEGELVKGHDLLDQILVGGPVDPGEFLRAALHLVSPNSDHLPYVSEQMASAFADQLTSYLGAPTGAGRYVAPVAATVLARAPRLEEFLVERLSAYLTDPDISSVGSAWRALAGLAPADAHGALLKLLESDVPAVRDTAVSDGLAAISSSVLGRQEAESAFDAIIRLVSADAVIAEIGDAQGRPMPPPHRMLLRNSLDSQVHAIASHRTGLDERLQDIIECAIAHDNPIVRANLSHVLELGDIRTFVEPVLLGCIGEGADDPRLSIRSTRLLTSLRTAES